MLGAWVANQVTNGIVLNGADQSSGSDDAKCLEQAIAINQNMLSANGGNSGASTAMASAESLPSAPINVIGDS